MLTATSKPNWIIDPEAGTVEVRFLGRGEYCLASRWRPGEQARSQLLKGFKVAVADLFASQRLPAKREP